MPGKPSLKCPQALHGSTELLRKLKVLSTPKDQRDVALVYVQLFNRELWTSNFWLLP